MGAKKLKETNKKTLVGRGAKIAAARGPKWKKNLAIGRRDAQVNPSIIRLVRLKNGVKQSELAKKVGVSVSVIGWIERGKQPVKKERAEQIANQLGTTIQRIFKSAGRKKYVAILHRAIV